MQSHSVLGSVGLLLLIGCSSGGPTPPTVNPPAAGPPRSFRMGWAMGAPRPDLELILALADSMAQVSEIAIIQQSVPWTELLAGAPMDSLVQDRGNIADFLRAKGLQIIFLVDPLDGLDRRKEPPELVDLGRSLLEPPIRAMHEEWVRRIAQTIQPEYFGLASEINTLAARGDQTLYTTIRDMVNGLAPEIRQRSPGSKVFVSFQVDEANGAFGPEPVDNFTLIDDFDIDVLGLSSYPVFVFDDPAQIPDNWFQTFDQATDLPLLLVEGGWSSTPTARGSGSPEQQAAFVARFETLLDGVNAEAFVMLTFTDLDIAALGLPPDRAITLANFAHMGILDTDLRRKPAYAEWERIFQRPLARIP